jgi:predicted PurR-regulated permease PerM
MFCNSDYLNESRLSRIQNRLATASVIAIIVLVAILPLVAMSQTVETVQPGFGPTIVAVRQAESAGATPSEIGRLVALLNKALELNGEAVKLTAPDQAPKRAEILAQVDQTLTTVENEAAELTVVASQRSYMNRVFAYAGGIVAAVIATILFAFIVSFYEKYRIKRTFQMRITRK